jgi:hypothetical protein
MSITAIPGRKPLAFTASSSGTAKLDSCALAVSTRHASGRPVVTQTALVELVAVEAAGRSGGDGRAVAPGGVGVGVVLALRAALVDVPLPVAVGRQVAGVDGDGGDGGAQFGDLLVQRGGHAVKAGVQQRPELLQLGGEPVAGMHARDAGNVRAAKGHAQGGVLADQGDGARPGRQGVEVLGQGHTDHRTDRVAGTTGPAGRFQLGHKLANLGLSSSPATCTASERGATVWLTTEVTSPGPDPRRLPPRGVILYSSFQF